MARLYIGGLLVTYRPAAANTTLSDPEVTGLQRISDVELTRGTVFRAAAYHVSLTGRRAAPAGATRRD